MIKQQAFKFALKLNEQQKANMLLFAGACRFVYNKGLALLKESYESGQKHMHYNQLAPLLVEWKSDPALSWLKQAPSQSLQQSLRDLDKAFSNFFYGNAEHPRFKKKGQHDAFRFPSQRVKVDQEKQLVLLPKLGWVKYRKSRDITGDIKNVSISGKLGKWYISFNTQTDIEEPVHPAISKIGVYVDAKKNITLSDGTQYIPPQSLITLPKQIQRLTNCLRKKNRYSNNWLKSKHRINRLSSRLNQVKVDYLHKASTAISKNHAMIVIADIEKKSFSADKQQKNITTCEKSTSIHYELIRQLTYKQEWLGGLVIKLPAEEQKLQRKTRHHEQNVR
ncbi:transposase [Escherichia coli]|nr:MULTISPECIES: RNA-guided endonuclease TnpB family protein [Enterobacteriaceae]EEZ8368436.1 transposase [Escherichia coli]EFB2916185.1 transposase [Escherichia coli]EFB9682835.1 transposase [Escherichia coli]EFB9978633.1 transposase [Escherichia coli]EFC0522284.1 transposase [Escherichia coli]